MKNHSTKTKFTDNSLLSVSYLSPSILDNQLNSQPDAVITTDPNFYITGLNAAAEAVYGFPFEDAMGKLLFELVRFDIIRQTLVNAITELHNKGSWNGEVIFHRFNGQPMHFNTSATLIRDKSGQVSSIVLVNHNIGQGKNIELVEDKYKTVVDTLSEGVVLINADGTIAASNKKGAEILGLTEEEIKGKVVASPNWNAIKEDGTIFPPGEFPAIETLRTGKENNEVVMGVLQPDGKRVWISVTSRPVYKEKNPIPEAVFASFKNITAEKEIRERLQKNEVLFQTFMNNSQTANWMYDANGYVVFANPVFNTISNASKDTMGKHILDIFPGELGQSLLKRNIEFLANPKQTIFHTDLKQADGKIRRFVSYLSIINIPGHDPLIAGQAIDLTEETEATLRSEQTELLFSTFMKNSPALGWIYDEEGTFVYGNPQFMETTGLTQASFGENMSSLKGSSEIKEKVLMRNQIALNQDDPLIIEDSVPDKNGILKHYISYWFHLPLTGEKRLIGGLSLDITDQKNAQSQIEKMHERFSYAVNASSDAIWDLDLKTKTIYRSDNFNKISGYSNEHIEPNLDWWFDKVHPEDKERVKNKINFHLENGIADWEDEYRFQFADGSYRHISDRGFAQYENNKPVRLIGAIQDISERKRLEAQLLKEQVQKQKLINQATIMAQEKERGMISAELHDNVNQLLMSARLHIGVAKKAEKNQDELLNKASDYLLMAVEEIRALSKKLNTSFIKSVGLHKSILDICGNLKELNNINVITDIDEPMITMMSKDQQLMVFRILQEQTTNITKYAQASSAMISIKEKNDHCLLTISDNGVGFDKTYQQVNGIGFINIFNRVDAYNGNVEIISAPGKGCTLNISFPVIKESSVSF